MKKPRNYRKEYATHGALPLQKKRRAARNAVRNRLLKKGIVHKGDKKEVDHINMNPLDNRPKNIRIVTKSFNRKRQPKRK